MHYYKVVRKEQDHLVSIVMDDTRLQVEYIPGEWVHSHHSALPLFAFNNLTLAVNFALSQLGDNLLRDMRIYSCEVLEATEARFMPNLNWEIRSLDEISQAWAIMGKECHFVMPINYSKVPPGTVFVKGIRLLEQVRETS